MEQVLNATTTVVPLDLEYSLTPVIETTTPMTTQKTISRDSYLQRSTGSEKASIVNSNSTAERSEDLLINRQHIKNAYSGPIDPTLVYPIKGADKLYIQIRDNVNVAQPNSIGSVILPYSASLSVTIPEALLSTSQRADVATVIIQRLLSRLYPKGMEDKSSFKELILGNLDLK